MYRKYKVYILASLFFVSGCASSPSINDGVGKGNSSKNNQSIKTSSCYLDDGGRRPGWVFNGKGDDDYVYAVGTAVKQKNFGEQKSVSEMYAKKELIAQVEVFMLSEYKSRTTQRTSESGASVNSDVMFEVREMAAGVLSGVKVVDRWSDISTCELHSLARVRKTRVRSIISQMID